MQLWLPSPGAMRIDFLHQILEDEKRVLEANDVKHINFNKHWQELAPKNAYENIKDDELLASFFPMEQIELGKMNDWVFFWGVCKTLRPGWTQEYMRQVQKGREGLIN